MRVDVHTELRRLRLDPQFSEEAARIVCPFHEDDTPSLDVFLDSCNFHCHGCKKSGDFATLLAKLENKPRHAAESDLLARYGGDDKPLDPAQIERWHEDVWGAHDLLKSLERRAVGKDIIRKYRLGRDGDRITIPIPGPSGAYCNVRRYLPDAPEGDRRPKMTNMRGRARLRVYPYEQLKYDRILLLGGEMKALAAGALLNPHGVGCVAITGGEGDWATALEGFFTAKRVWVCNDVDLPGVQATEARCLRLNGVAEAVYPLFLPLSVEEFPSGDMNDYIALHGATEETAQRLLELMGDCSQYQPAVGVVGPLVSKDEEPYEDPKEAVVTSINDPAWVNRRMRTRVAVTAMDQAVYYAPKTVQVHCKKDQDYCAVCPVLLQRKETFEIRPESPSILAMIDIKKTGQREEIREAIRVPAVCKVATLETVAHYKVVETRVQRSLELTENASDRASVPVVVVDAEVENNETYDMVGRPVPHPKTQVATIIASEAKAVADALTSYDPGDTSDLHQFRPARWTAESVDDKMRQTYDFYSRNVTRIYARPRLHALCDLVFHSVLSVPCDGDHQKGYLELLVIGDSSQGKTEVTKRLCDWYGLGVRVDCKNATVAGLSGGLEQINGKWFAQWGVLPIHDRRLVVLEELKGMHPAVFAKLTDVRSSGEAQIPKIHRAIAKARARLIVVSNPKRENATMSAYAFGVKAVSELVPNPEDVRRFDAACILNKDDVAPAVFNAKMSRVTALFESEAARHLVLWAWTRERHHVLVDDPTWGLVVKTANWMAQQYSDSIPLLDRGSTKLKLLKWAAAAAARTFSTDPTGLQLVVRPCHVEWVTSLLCEEYDSASCGYLAYSQSHAARGEGMDEKATLKAVAAMTLCRQTAQMLLGKHDLDYQDMCDTGGLSAEEGRLIVSRLVRSGAITRVDRLYVKTPAFIALLKRVAAGELDQEAPAHVQADEY